MQRKLQKTSFMTLGPRLSFQKLILAKLRLIFEEAQTEFNFKKYESYYKILRELQQNKLYNIRYQSLYE